VDAPSAFTAFVHRTLTSDKARRFAALAETPKGQRKVLRALCHEFEPAILPHAVHAGVEDSVWAQPCYIFEERLGFGIEAPSARNAYDQLSIQDSWLIILRDASAGIHRPESRWDAEKFIKA
jgi:hypothetical protein